MLAPKFINNGMNRRWTCVTTAPLPNGTYIIRSRVNTSQVLEIVGSSTGNNGNVAMWKYHGGGNQKLIHASIWMAPIPL